MNARAKQVIIGCLIAALAYVLVAAITGNGLLAVVAGIVALVVILL